MDRETLYKFFEGAASYEEEVRIRQWMEHSPENRREFLKERKIFDSMLLLGDEKTIEEKMRHKSWSLSSLSELRSFSRNIRSNQNPCLSSFTVLETCNNSSFQEGSGIF